MNTTQQRFEGFLNTPVLWKDSEVYYLTQFKIEQELLSFDQVIDSNQRLGKYVERFVSFQLSQDKSIEIVSENIQTGKIKHCNSSYFTMVAKDEIGNNAKVPTLILSNLEDVRRFYDCVIRINQKKKNKILEEKFDHTSEKSIENLFNYNVKLEIK